MWLYGIEAADTSVDLMVTVKTGDSEESYTVYVDAETMEKIKKQGIFE